MADSYHDRIQAAERELEEARLKRDREYPNSTAWLHGQGVVAQWESTLADLRAAARGAGENPVA